MNIVLIHGGWHGPWMWEGVERSLQAQGHSTMAVELPFSGFADDVGAAKRAIEEAGPGAVVCAHSYGGLVVSEAARNLSAAHLVYLAAFMVDEDEDWMASWFAVPTLLHAALVVSEGMVTVEPTKAKESFYGDADEETVRMVIPRLRRMSSVERRPHRRPPAWRDVPSTYVVCTRDRAIDPEVQRAMAAHATTVVEVAADHSPFLTMPDEVAAIITSSAGNRD